MPTIALIPGHAFAAGFMTAMMHDYRLMNPHRGYLCLNELDFGAPLTPPMASIFRQKVPNPNTFRTMILESKRYGALEALKEGLLDGLGDVGIALDFVNEGRLVDRARSGVYGRLKQEMWRETVGLLEGFAQGEERVRMGVEEGERRKSEEMRKVEAWEAKTTTAKSKL